MRKMSGLILGIAAVAALAAAPAFAADIRPPVYTKAPPLMAPPPSWTGFYIGADLGGLWDRTNANFMPFPSAAAFGDNPNGSRLLGSSVVGGVHAGYNYQFAPSWVAGLEGDWSGTHAHGSVTQPLTVFPTGVAVGPGAVTAMDSTLDWLASLRGRFGYLITPNVLAYATGGAAWGDLHYSGIATNPATGYAASSSFNRIADGYVVGGGLEWAMTTNWSVRAEYLFYRLYSSESVVAPAPGFAGFPSGLNWNNTNVNVVRAGFSYKF